MSHISLFFVTAATTAIIGFIPAYIIVRRTIVDPLGSPPCDRCGNDTGKPWLWSQKGTPWHCTECDQWLTDQLFPDMDSPDYDRAQHAAFLRAYMETKQRPAA